MTPEVIRRQYLDAMGITAWASCYQLPNARPTQACEWEEAPAQVPSRERLHALLDDAPAPRSQPSTKPDAAASPSAVRALLDNAPVAEPPPEGSASTAPSVSVPEPAKPLNFSFSCQCIGGRLLSVSEGEMSPVEQQLLANMLRAAGVLEGDMPTVSYFKWPPMATSFTPEEPLEEAQEGMAAFVAGAASRQGWRLEQVLWWGAQEAVEESPFARVMALANAQSQTLALPVWQGPALASLTQSAEAKRALWPRLVALGEQWRKSAQ
ncbi:hypothetical protein LOS15_00445 [Halomonas sp. 7T]|uniref:hypothetical protein n=1 Tax=Halomonas sp. 7T TaxID=2893469 RepID=UPI0021DB6C33|nr:hypothetical protein [Halomonas sp. 7T]UXZ54543.1 hypothetical protein LOS15_00445 [Halomonas sp. 7T]